MNRRELLQAAGAALAGATVLPYLSGPASTFVVDSVELLEVATIPCDGGYLVPEHFAREFLEAWRVPLEILEANTTAVDRLRQSLETWGPRSS